MAECCMSSVNIWSRWQNVSSAGFPNPHLLGVCRLGLVISRSDEKNLLGLAMPLMLEIRT